MLIDALARTAESARPIFTPTAPTGPAFGSVAPAQPEFVEMTHIRTFFFDPISTDDIDAFSLALTLPGPCVGMIADGTVAVLEANGEALMSLLKGRALDFKYESSWVPSTSSWLADFYAAPDRDQDNWH